MALRREQAGVQLTDRRQPRSHTGPAEGSGHTGDDPDLTGTIEVAVALGDLPITDRIDGLDRPTGVDPVLDLVSWHDTVALPVVGGAHVHELDEPQRHRPLTCPLREVFDLMVVDASLQDRVDLDRVE